MKLSRTTVFAPIPDRDDVLLVQPLTAQVAILEAEAAAALREVESGAALPASLDLDVLRQAGFVVDGPGQDKAMMAEAYADFREEQHKTPTQLIVVPTFACNFKCTYCYQEPFDPDQGRLVSPEVIDAFFAWLDRFHGADDPKPYVTLFGGEPLVDTPTHHDRLRRYMDGVAARGLKLAAVTNGYDLAAFADELAAGPVREVQVTLDGPEAVHDLRRVHASGRGTFHRVVAGIQSLVDRGVPVNLRVVADRQNLAALPELARLCDDKGWLDLPQERFKTQIGRNYELFGCASRQRREELLDRAGLWRSFVELSEVHPLLRKFHSPRFHGIGHLAATGEFPMANFDACPAGKKEWAFAPDGSVYGCTATVGNEKYRFGKFYPEVVRDDDATADWEMRSILTIPECKSCAHATICGGGCGAIASDRNGTPLSPDCRPVPEVMGLGVRYYGL
jgi:uncharacterized protein